MLTKIGIFSKIQAAKSHNLDFIGKNKISVKEPRMVKLDNKIPIKNHILCTLIQKRTFDYAHKSP
jgi:hypothetical protein